MSYEDIQREQQELQALADAAAREIDSLVPDPRPFYTNTWLEAAENLSVVGIPLSECLEDIVEDFRFIKENFSPETVQAAYEVIDHNGLTPAPIWFALSLDAGVEQDEVSDDGPWCTGAGEGPHYLSRLSIHTVLEDGKRHDFLSFQGTDSMSAHKPVEIARKIAAEEGGSVYEVMAFMDEEMRYDPGSAPRIGYYTALDPEGAVIFNRNLGRNAAIAYRYLCDVDTGFQHIQGNPHWLQRKQELEREALNLSDQDTLWPGMQR